MESIRLAIADDNNVIQNYLNLGLKESKNIRPIITASNGKELLDKLHNTKVDVPILDISMPVLDGFYTIIQLQMYFPELKVIMFSSDLNEETISYFKKFGALEFLPKESRISTITEAINKVYRKKGRTVMKMSYCN